MKLPMNKHVRRGLLGLVTIFFIAAIALLSMNIRSQLAELGTASSDNVQWVLSQTEVELLVLGNAIADAKKSDNPDLYEIRRRFDIFYSRIYTIKESPIFAQLRSLPAISANINHLSKFLDDTVPIIDGDDAALLAALPKLSTDVSVARFHVRDAALEGITFFSEVSDNRRISVAKTLIYVALLTSALILILILLVYALNRSVHKSNENARQSRETRDRLETVISTSLDAVIVIDEDGKVLEYNGAAERIFGYSYSDVIGADMAELIIPDHLRKGHDEGMLRFRRGAPARVVNKGIVQLEAKRKNGEHFPIDLSIAAATRPEGVIYVGFIRDISSRVAAEKELLSARDEAIAGEKSKANMLAVMSHEMRTPLNGMLGTLDLFDADKLDRNHQRYLRVIRSSGNLLLGHINDVLDISRLDADKMSMSMERFDLGAALQETVDAQAAHAKDHGNTIELSVLDTRLHDVYSDRIRVCQIVTNLLNNAIKFTRNGHIAIEAECHNGLDDVELRVVDSGIGISEENLERIFGDFVTIDSSYSRNNGGTGLGLGISQRLITALGGEIGAESELGDGSVFWLRMPMRHPPESEKTRSSLIKKDIVPTTPSRKLSVLLVEDNAVNRLVAREMLLRDGHTVTEAHNGCEGVQLAEQMKFDVILMDISMPEMDGVEATGKIRESRAGSWRAPIIATTAHVLKNDMQRFRDAGMNEVLSKPISIARMRKALASVVERVDKAPLLETEPSVETEVLIDWEQAETVKQTLPPKQLAEAIETIRSEMVTFFKDLPGMIETSSDFKPLGEEAHRLAGSAAVFGAVRLAGLFRAIQFEAENNSLKNLRALKIESKQCWKETCEEYMARMGPGRGA